MSGTLDLKALRRRLKTLGIRKTRGPERGFAPNFPTPGPVTPRREAEAIGYHLERVFGQKVAQCPNCRAHRVWENHARAAWHCDECGFDISSRLMEWVPRDENARRPEERGEPLPRELRRYGTRS